MYEIMLSINNIRIKNDNGVINLCNDNIRSFTLISTNHIEDKITKLVCVLSTHIYQLIPYITINLDHITLYFAS